MVRSDTPVLGTSHGPTDGAIIGRSKTSLSIITIAVEIGIPLNKNHGRGGVGVKQREGISKYSGRDKR
jgi:hypothetical protein